MPYRRRNGLPICTASGVYSITNRVNSKVYIGSAVNVTRRLACHRYSLRRGCHDNSYLQRAWNKHGEANFQFDVIEECSVETLYDNEQKWINNRRATDRKCGYNLAEFAGRSPMLGRNHTEESRKQMSEKQKTACKVGQPLATEAARLVNTGRKLSKEHCQAISDGQKGRDLGEDWRQKIITTHWSKRPDAAEIVERSAAKHRGKKHTEEHKAKIGASLLGRKRGKYKRRQPVTGSR